MDDDVDPDYEEQETEVTEIYALGQDPIPDV